MTTHLATPTGLLCGREARWPARVGDLRDVTCKACTSRLDRLIAAGNDAAFERRLREEHRRAAHAVGFGEAWEWATATDSPAQRMIAGLLGAIAVGLIESGYTTTPDLADTG